MQGAPVAYRRHRDHEVVLLPAWTTYGRRDPLHARAYRPAAPGAHRYGDRRPRGVGRVWRVAAEHGSAGAGSARHTRRPGPVPDREAVADDGHPHAPAGSAR